LGCYKYTEFTDKRGCGAAREYCGSRPYNCHVAFIYTDGSFI